ncbi:ATP-dependent Clp endopeptidase proteolytic subunit [Pseudomonas phage Psp6]|nr:ATP-dependent Clp endopeptidase proteolytic subunit [Pseudomonas phage Psp6]
MKRKGLPLAMRDRPGASVRFDISETAMKRWDSTIVAAASADESNVINIFGVIGEDYWTGDGWTAKRVSGLLRYIGADQPVTVNINSPGGDMFEGLAIYNLLREHKGDVTTKVLGVAASAASVIAVGGDKVQIARSAFYMIHNAWFLVAGNRHQLREYADHLEPFDKAMADIYSARTGGTIEEMAALMDDETWIGGSDSVEQGFADSLLAADEVGHDEGDTANAAAQIDRALAVSGMPRSERRRLLSQIKTGTQIATEPDDTPRAVSGEASKLSAQLVGIL